MSKKKPEVRCPHCGGTAFIETIHQIWETTITTDTGLNRRSYQEVKPSSQQFCYKCMYCYNKFYAYNAEAFYEELKKVCALLGKKWYAVNYEKCRIEQGVAIAPLYDFLYNVYLCGRTVPVKDLYKTKKAAVQALLKDIEQRMLRTAHVRDEHDKEYQEYEKKYKELKRSIR